MGDNGSTSGATLPQDVSVASAGEVLLLVQGIYCRYFGELKIASSLHSTGSSKTPSSSHLRRSVRLRTVKNGLTCMRGILQDIIFQGIKILPCSSCHH